MDYVLVTSTVATSISRGAVDAYHCVFGLSSLVLCKYNPAQPPIYFSLGEAVSAVGLIFAAWQLGRPSWKMIMKIRGIIVRNLIWVFLILGLIFAIIASVIPQFYYLLPAPFNHSLLYEIMASICYVLAPISFIFFSTRTKGLFNEKNSRRFYEVMVQEISKNNNEITNAALEVLLSNFNNICQLARNSTNKEAQNSACAILEVILSDESIVKILTTKRLDALRYVFEIIEQYGVTQRESGIGIPAIVKNLFYDRDSFLYKHLGRDGLALSSNIYDRIFDSPILLSNFNLFDYPSLDYVSRREMDNMAIQVFIEALSRSIKAYLKTGKVPARHINNGISYLSEIFGDLCFKISSEEGRGVDTQYILKNEWWALHLISNFLGHDYPFLAYDEEVNNDVVEVEKLAAEADFYSNYTINAGIAAALYKAFVQLSYIQKTTDTYHTVLELLHGLMYEASRKEGYKKPFEKRMWEQIGINVFKRHYPSVLRVYLVFIGFCLVGDKDHRQGWIGEQAELMRKLLYNDLKPLLDKDEKMINEKKMKEALLPQVMDYKDGKFTYRFDFGRGEEKEILPPANDLASALNGVDLETKSLL